VVDLGTAGLPGEARRFGPALAPSPTPREPMRVESSPTSMLRAGQLAAVLVAVVAVDWGTKAMAWRLLPGRVIINADTSGAIPVLPGLVSHWVLGAVVDAAVLLLLVISGAWLTRVAAFGGLAWTGAALVWAGIASNAMDRWIGHLWLAPGSRRGAVDWIDVANRAAINLADVTIGVGLVLVISALAATRIPRRARAAVAIGVALLIPVSMLTAGGSASNAPPPPAAATFGQQARATLLVGSKYQGRRVVWRQPPPLGWNVTVDAVDAQDRILAQWHLLTESKVGVLELPKGTHAIYVTLDATGEVMVLANGLS